MYTEHFGLNEKPFSISPDPRYLYLSQRHADALAHLLYGISESGGFIQLTGEVGTGKTTLIRSLLGQLPENTEIALILNPRLSTKQFLQSICQELRVPLVTRDTAKTLIDKLNIKLLERHSENHRVVLIVDEAQTMSPELLEQVRLLTNLETEKQKLLQIILIGQPELREVLGRPNMRQIAQRITGRYHLEPINAPDTAVYVAHRLKVAGGRPEIFSPRAIRKLYRLSRGVPRLINIIADRSLLAAYARDNTRIRARTCRQGSRRGVRPIARRPLVALGCRPCGSCTSAVGHDDSGNWPARRDARARPGRSDGFPDQRSRIHDLVNTRIQQRSHRCRIARRIARGPNHRRGYDDSSPLPALGRGLFASASCGVRSGRCAAASMPEATEQLNQ